ncbi:MAG TPA: hypothetical protein VES42_19775 [Pilimelia sp.]|nr:hypothetical protein [Pilimelia sp.]
MLLSAGRGPRECAWALAHLLARLEADAARRQLSLNRRIALHLLRQRLERGDDAAERAVTDARWRIHDQLVRGNPTRVERPSAGQLSSAGTAEAKTLSGS